MDLEERFNQSGGGYYKRPDKISFKQEGGGKKRNLSPRTENWKRKYLLQKKECELLKRENSILKRKLSKFDLNK